MKCLIKLLVIVRFISPILSDCLQIIDNGKNWTVIVPTYRAYAIGDEYKNFFNVAEKISTYCHIKENCNVPIDPIMNLNKEFYRNNFRHVVRQYLKENNLEFTNVTSLPLKEYAKLLIMLDKTGFDQGYYIDTIKGFFVLWNPLQDRGYFCYEGPATESVLNTNQSVHYLTFLNQNVEITLEQSEMKMVYTWNTKIDYVFLRYGINCFLPISFSNLTSLLMLNLPPTPPQCNNTYLTNIIIISSLCFVLVILIIVYFTRRHAISAYLFSNCCRKNQLEARGSSYRTQTIKNDQMDSYVEPLEVHTYSQPDTRQEKFYDLQGNRIPIEINEQNQSKPEYDYAYSHKNPSNISEGNISNTTDTIRAND
ncbi:uncharacterized protein LOC126878777 [Diabrotica virgifera virgifera]|nr:uncharacterized protein LOC126878777 [Diabrotica virgifera virgifera]